MDAEYAFSVEIRDEDDSQRKLIRKNAKDKNNETGSYELHIDEYFSGPGNYLMTITASQGETGEGSFHLAVDKYKEKEEEKKQPDIIVEEADENQDHNEITEDEDLNKDEDDEDALSGSDENGEGGEDSLSESEADEEGEEEVLSESDVDGEGEEEVLSESDADGEGGEDSLSESEADEEGEEGLSESDADGEGEEEALSESDADGEGEEGLSESDADGEGEEEVLSESDADGEGEEEVLSDSDANEEGEDVLSESDADEEGEKEQSELTEDAEDAEEQPELTEDGEDEDELSELAENGEAEGESTEEELAEIGIEEDETLIPTDEEPEEEFFEKELKTDDGNTYRITVRINSDSGIPENANLLVRPIEKGSAEYEEYYRRAAETAGEGILEEVRFFDISLVNPENPEEHYQPKDEASVSVSIILLDFPVEEGMVEQVIHFQEEGTNTPEVLHSTEVTRDSTTQEISFETGSFSVFGVTYKSVAEPIRVIDVSYYGGSAKAYELTTEEQFKGIAFLLDSTGETDSFYISGDITLSKRLTVTGNVNLILGGTLTVPRGITVSKGNSLTVYGTGSPTGGNLIIQSPSSGNAGIGGISISAVDAGNFTLHSGTVTVKGGDGAAGIGGGEEGAGGSITITGGSLNAAGGDSGAGLGGGFNAGQGDSISISGGTVIATGGTYGAGIGGGEHANDSTETDTARGGNGGRVNITGGTVTANGGMYAAGIGGGFGGNGGQVSVSAGSKVTANGGSYGGAGVGGGANGSGGTLSVSGTQSENSATVVTAQVGKSSGGEAIGHGGRSGSSRTQTSGNIVLTDAAIVKAGSSASSAVEYGQDKSKSERADACRNPYAQISASISPNYAITAKLTHSSAKEQERANKTGETDVEKVLILDASTQKEITDLRSGKNFILRVTTSKADTLVDVTASYGSDNTSMTPSATTVSNEGKTHDYTYKMPAGNVSIAVTLTGVSYTITIRSDPNGKVSLGETGSLTGTAVSGDRVVLTNTPAAMDYYLAWMKISEDQNGTAGKVIAEMKGNELVNLSTLPGESSWVFNMPAHNVIIDLEYRKGVYYVDQDGLIQVRKYFFLLKDSDRVLNTSGLEDGWYVVQGNVKIDARLHLKQYVHLILCDGASLTVKGIFVDGGSGGALEIFAQDAGSGSISSSGSDCAGIGGKDGTRTGAIVIHGGQIKAWGSTNNPGIGAGGRTVLDQDLKILLPPGKSNSYLTVEAHGGEDGAGIGGGYDQEVKHNIEITGGIIKAWGGRKGAGIGTGDDANLNADILISGGEIEAHGGKWAAGIGAGCREGGSGGDFKDGHVIKITGGTVKAWGEDDGAGIGTGEDGHFAGDVEVWGGYVEARSDDKGAGIGSGEDGSCTGWFKIYGGTVDARLWDNEGAPIGGGSGEAGGYAEIKGGKVITWSEDVAVGIGGASGESNRTINIADHMGVTWGDKQNQDTNRAKAADRVNRIQTKHFVVIQACPHPEHYCVQKDDHVHTIKCSYCNMDGKDQEHRYAEDESDPNYYVCLDCGYNRGRIATLKASPSRHIAQLYKNNQLVKGSEVKYQIGEQFTVRALPLPGEGAIWAVDSVTGTYKDEKGAQQTLTPIASWSDEPTVTCYTFVMPKTQYSDSPLELTAKFVMRSYNLRVVVNNSYAGTASLSKTVANPNDTITVQAVPNDGYVLEGISLEYGETKTNLNITKAPYRFTMPAENAVVYVNFRKQYTANVYPVFQDENGAWPDSATSALDTKAVETYRVAPASQILADEVSKRDYLSELFAKDADAANGFEPKYYSFTYTTNPETSGNPAAVNTAVALSESIKTVYVYYTRKSFQLNFYSDIAGQRKLETISLPYGEKLSNYVNYRTPGERITLSVPGYTYPVDRTKADLWYFDAWSETPKTDGEYSHKESKRDGENCKIANLSLLTMPTASKNLYPVLIKYRVKVILDLNAYDTEAHAEPPKCLGKFWDESEFSAESKEHASPATDAHMSEHQARTFMTDIGEKIQMNGEANTTGEKQNEGMNQANRDGYILSAWYTKNGVRWSASKVSDVQYADSDTLKTYDQDGEYYQYYTMTLLARWTSLRSAKLIFQAGEGSWEKNADAPAMEVGYRLFATIPEGNTIEGNVLNRPDGKKLVGWKAENGTIYKPGSNFVFRSLNQVDVIGSGTDENGNLIPNTIYLTAVYITEAASQSIVFDTQGGSLVTQVTGEGENVTLSPVEGTSVEFPEGSTDSEKTVTIEYADDNKSFTMSIDNKKFNSPEKEGYQFDGWKSSEKPEKTFSVTVHRSQTGEQKIITLYAIWKPITYTITFHPNGGVIKIKDGTPLTANEEGSFTDRLAYGTPLYYSPDGTENQPIYTAEKEHYIFDGWSPELPKTMMEDITVEAIWDPEDYTITLDANGGTFTEDGADSVTSKTVTQDYLTLIKWPAEPAHSEGKTLMGWVLTEPAKAATGDLPAELPSQMPGEDRTYQAVWESLILSTAANGDGKTASILVKQPKAGMEYRIDGGEWQRWHSESGEELIFDDLEPNRKYEVDARYSPVDAYNYPGSRIVSASITTPRQSREAPEAPSGAAGFQVIQVYGVQAGMEYALKERTGEEVTLSEDDWQQADRGRVYFKGLTEGKSYLLYARRAETDQFKASAASEPTELTTMVRMTSLSVPEGQEIKVFVNIATSYQPNEASGASYQWYAQTDAESGEGAKAIEDAVYSEYMPTAKEYRKYLRVVASQISPITNDERHGIDTEGRHDVELTMGPVQKGKGLTPKSPILKTTGVKFLTIEAKADEEYLIIPAGDKLEDHLDDPWQRIDGKDLLLGNLTVTFTGLKEKSPYQIYARMYETEAYEISGISEPCSARTDPRMTGVRIDGTPKAYEMLTAKVAPEDVTTVSYQWYRDGEPIVNATQETYRPSATDVGCKLTVRATQIVDDIETIEKEDTVGPVIKADGEETDPPELDRKGTRFITIIIDNREMDEFSIDGGKTWQKEATFSGLQPDTEYEIIARRAETDSMYAGPASEALKVRTQDVGTIRAYLDSGEETPAMKLEKVPEETILKLAGTEIASRQDNGEDLEMIVRIRNIDKTVSAGDKALVTQALTTKAKNAKADQYLDISVFLKIGKDAEIRLTDLGDTPVKLTLTVPEANRAKNGEKRTFYMVRVHQGKAEILTSGAGPELTFTSGLFSTYGLGESDEAIPTATPTVRPTTSPRTADDSQMALWIAVFALLLVGLIAFNIFRRRSGKPKENSKR